MNFLTFILLLAVGVCEAVLSQKLSCPHELKHQSLQRVWCRQTSAECCTGFAFNQNTQMLDGGKLKVTQHSHSFTVVMMEPDHSGVYWCGVLTKNNTIIKLAEGYFYSSSGAFIWSLARWILLPLVLVVTLSTYVCLSKKKKFHYEKAEEMFVDAAAE
ncbi:uncharacterized protein si:ch211-102c2.4 [Melanotaenia boesemani]|uniref:uncharacterized protein si:ch211-102c2.4 n=1 Tax=Melanotaenia boesemani TaxID=1250792 RepID=UPI001C05C867|nr:uncharacterized protein si:ch211-102c2.4 [Melanotaenia boesemani]